MWWAPSQCCISSSHLLKHHVETLSLSAHTHTKQTELQLPPHCCLPPPLWLVPRCIPVYPESFKISTIYEKICVQHSKGFLEELQTYCAHRAKDLDSRSQWDILSYEDETDNSGTIPAKYMTLDSHRAAHSSSMKAIRVHMFPSVRCSFAVSTQFSQEEVKHITFSFYRCT